MSIELEQNYITELLCINLNSGHRILESVLTLPIGYIVVPFLGNVASSRSCVISKETVYVNSGRLFHITITRLC